MSTIKKMIPVWIKAPIAVFLREVGKLPFHLTLSHMYYSFTQNSNCSAKRTTSARHKIQQKNYAYLTKWYKRIAIEAAPWYSSGERPNPVPIWVFWWQGENEAPEIVKRCIAAVCRNADAHPVHIIDKSNCQDFVEVPEQFPEKVGKRNYFTDSFFRLLSDGPFGQAWRAVDRCLYLCSASYVLLRNLFLNYLFFQSEILVWIPRIFPLGNGRLVSSEDGKIMRYFMRLRNY